MALESGTRFGSYEVAESIGAGGMGEVFRARDTKLKRYVALKVLPASFADDAERLARFQREAEILAALNHANIAALEATNAKGIDHRLFLAFVRYRFRESASADAPRRGCGGR